MASTLSPGLTVALSAAEVPPLQRSLESVADVTGS